MQVGSDKEKAQSQISINCDLLVVSNIAIHLVIKNLNLNIDTT